MSGGHMLEVDGVSKHFGGLKVFDDVSLRLDRGQVLGVIGPNGAGKTTLINVVCGKLRPSRGRILLDRVDVSGKPVYELSRAGLVRSFQQTNTFKTSTVRANIARAVRFSGATGRPSAALAAMVQDFGLAARLDEFADKLPYGLQKMLGLVMTFATRPKILLLDEPAAGLERRERHRVDQFVRLAVEELQCGVLVVEHDMDLIRRLCPSILVLDAGRVIASGPPQEVLARPDVIDAYLGTAGEEDA